MFFRCEGYRREIKTGRITPPGHRKELSRSDKLTAPFSIFIARMWSSDPEYISHLRSAPILNCLHCGDICEIKSSSGVSWLLQLIFLTEMCKID